MSLQSLFKNPEYLIRRFRYPTLYGSTLWIYILLLITVCGLGYTFFTYPAYFLIGCGVFYLFTRFVNKIFEAVIQYKYFELRFDSNINLIREIAIIKHQLGFEKPIKVYIRRGSPDVKVFSLLGVRRIFLGSELLRSEVSGEQYKFSIAQAILIFKIRRMFFSYFELFVEDFHRLFLFNVFLYPFERAACYTADRIASLFSGTHEHAKNMMRTKLIGHNEYYLNADAFIKQAEINDNFFGWIVNLFSKYPSSVRRMRSIQKFYEKYMIVYAKRHESDTDSVDQPRITLEIY